MIIYNYNGELGQGELVNVSSLQEALALKPYGMFSINVEDCESIIFQRSYTDDDTITVNELYNYTVISTTLMTFEKAEMLFLRFT